MQHRPRKRFGQNFLVDQRIITQIVGSLGLRSGDHVVEIGPGHGALTAELLEYPITLDAIEIDRDLHAELAHKFARHKNFHLHNADALTFDLSTIQRDIPTQLLRLIGNLPYNISSPLLFKLFAQHTYIHDMFFMLQREVAVRLTAQPGCKDYGRLTVMAQYYCDIHILIDVPPTAFIPQPKVDSSVVYFKPRSDLPVVAYDKLNQVVTLAFNQRRKTIGNSLRSIVTEQTLRELQINPQVRAENLTMLEYVKISNHCREY